MLLSRRSLIASGAVSLPLLSRQGRRAHPPAPPKGCTCMAYKDFGTPGKVNAALDTSGQNVGNLTTTFIPTNLGIKLSEFVIYHMVLENLTFGINAKITQNATTWGYTPLAGTNPGMEWYGSLFMKSSDEMRFLWNKAPNGPPVTNAPGLTCYIVYDPDLPGNTGYRA